MIAIKRGFRKNPIHKEWSAAKQMNNHLKEQRSILTLQAEKQIPKNLLFLIDSKQ